MEDEVQTEINPELLTKTMFEAEMLERVNSDFNNSKLFLNDYHRDCQEAEEMYFNASNYINLRQAHKFPIPTIQELTDVFVAHIRDKLFYANKPCTIIPGEKTDKADADAKQAMMEWQDYKDKIPTKLASFIKDCALKRMCVAKIDYVEHKKKEWVVKTIQMPTPTPFIKQMLGYPPLTYTAQKVWSQETVYSYKGPEVSRIDPTHFFFSPDKEETNDRYPVMIQSFVSKEYFNSEDYFFNQDKIDRDGSDRAPRSETDVARDAMVGQNRQTGASDRTYEYIEWQGLVKKSKLYRFTGQDGEPDPNGEISEIDPTEEVWAICGVVNGDTVVRLQESDHNLNGPNVVVGYVEKDAGNYIGIGPAQKASACHKGAETVMGMYLENLHQSVNAMWGMDSTKLVDSKPIVNKAGTIVLTRGNPREAIMRIDQPGISADLYRALGMFKQWMLDAYGLQNITQGKADENADTLGEATMVEQNASLRMRDYLKYLEDTFIQPLYEMRNQINMNFLDQEYIYGVIGEKAFQWRTISPEKIRSSVDFICESSTRETNRAVQIQQILQMIKITSTIDPMRSPVRQDRMLQDLAQSGFTMSKDQVLSYFPMIKLEEENDLKIDEAMVKAALLNLGLQASPEIAGMKLGGMPPSGGGGGNPATPMSEEEAMANANRANQTNLRETV